MAEVKDIRDAYFEKGKNISQIAKQFGIDRKTVRKFIEREDWNEQPERVCTRASVPGIRKRIAEDDVFDLVAGNKHIGHTDCVAFGVYLLAEKCELKHSDYAC